MTDQMGAANRKSNRSPLGDRLDLLDSAASVVADPDWFAEQVGERLGEVRRERKRRDGELQGLALGCEVVGRLGIVCGIHRLSWMPQTIVIARRNQQGVA